jgi:hypothetical protein
MNPAFCFTSGIAARRMPRVSNFEVLTLWIPQNSLPAVKKGMGMIKTLLNTVVIGGLLGAVNGLIWALGVNTTFGRGLIIGSIAGAIGCTLITIFGVFVAASSKGSLAPSETAFVSGSMTTMLGMVSAVLGIIVWILRITIW